MSVYSYVELKVHTNVWKVGTHLNVWLIYWTYVRWKYTFMFAYKKKRSIYLYIMNISLSRPFLSIIYYSILYLYTEMGTLFPATFLPFPLFTLILFYYIYSIYREEHTFPQLFTPFPIVLLYSLYIEWYTLFPPLFLPSYKVNTFTPPLSLSFWNVTYGKSLRGKVFENFTSIVL